jgi:hypothetical protein
LGKIFLMLLAMLAYVFAGFDSLSLRIQKNLYFDWFVLGPSDKIFKSHRSFSGRLYQVVEASGDVEIRTETEPNYRPLKVGEFFAEGAVLRTSESANVELALRADYRKLRLGGLSAVKILALKEGESGAGGQLIFRLLRGSLEIKETAPRNSELRKWQVVVEDAHTGQSRVLNEKPRYRFVSHARNTVFTQTGTTKEARAPADWNDVELWNDN